MSKPSPAPDVEADVAALRADPEMAAMFFADVVEQTAAIEAGVLRLEAAPGDATLVDGVFRPFHTIKGNAAIVGAATVREIAHGVEELLDLCRARVRIFGSAEADVALEATDLMRALAKDLQVRIDGGAGVDLGARRRALLTQVAALAAASSTPVPAGAADAGGEGVSHRAAPATAAASPAAHESPAAVKVDTVKLDNLVDMVGELVIAHSILEEDVGRAAANPERMSRTLAAVRRITGDLQRTAMSMRMVPIRHTFRKMARLVRDLARHSGKSIELTLEGEDTELDRRIVEDLTDPLMHMIRNSVDHGIEAPAVRVERGKPASGRIGLRAYHRGGSVVIEIRDDGAGLDLERLRARGIAGGLIAPHETPSAAELYQLIFHPGFSTAERVTEISGRGVGMDVVRRNIDELRGRIDIRSTPQQGTVFDIVVPLTLAILDGLILGVGGSRFVVPTFAVRESFRPRPEQLHSVHGAPGLVEVRSALLPLVRLGDVFGLSERPRPVSESMVVVLEDDAHAIALVVDDLLGKQDVVIKSLGDAFGQVPGVVGGAILGDGRVSLILDAHGLIRRWRLQAPKAA